MSAVVPDGYKRTEVGVMPGDWETESLGRIGQWFSGGTPSLSNASYWSGDIPWVSPKDMKLPRLWDAIDHISPKAITDGARVLPVGAVLMVIRGMILAHSFPVARVERPLAFNQDIKAVVPRADVDSNFVLYWLMANRQRLRSLTTESTHGTKRLPSEALFREEFCRPPLIEQRAIATALSDVDALLVKLDALVAKKRDLKQAAMQQLLTGQTRLPGFSGEWEVKRLGELLTYEQPTKYLVSSSEYSDANDVPVLTAGKTFILGYTHETEGIYAELPAIIFDDFTTATKYVTFPFKAKSSAMKILKPRSPSVNLRLVYEIMQVIDFKLGDHKRYWISEYSKLEVKIPGEVEQTAIATVLSDMDAELTALDTRRDKTRALKQGMMQELLTGRIRLV